MLYTGIALPFALEKRAVKPCTAFTYFVGDGLVDVINCEEFLDAVAVRFSRTTL
jgi:hypothetical protein